jgi:hypothetical protein
MLNYDQCRISNCTVLSRVFVLCFCSETVTKSTVMHQILALHNVYTRMTYVCNVTFFLLITIYAPMIYTVPCVRFFDAGRYIKVSSQRLIIEMYLAGSLKVFLEGSCVLNR